METTYEWKIEELVCLPQNNFVLQALWRCNASSDVGYSASSYGVVAFPVPDKMPKTMTPYEDLTEQQVLKWVWSFGVPKDETELALARDIERQANPPAVSQPLPWAASTN